MRLFVMTVRDRAADVFAQPYFTASIGSAVRAFGDEINRQAADNALYNHSEDFDLYQLGTYDDSNGTFECGEPRQVAVGKDLKRS